MKSLVLNDAPSGATSTACKSSLPPLKFGKQKTVFLDLDHTLIYSVSETCPSKYDFIVEYHLLGHKHVRYVLKSPFVDEFLRFLNEKKFEIVIFTAGAKHYASPILDKLDPKGFIAHRLYRDSCKILDGKRVKDISCYGRDLKNVVIIDDKPRYYRLQPDNALRIKPFTDNIEDVELIRLMEYFKGNRFLPKKEMNTSTAMPSTSDDVGSGEVLD